MAEILRRHRDGQEGITLVELLVTMVIMGILGAMVVASSVTAHKASGRTSDRLQSVGEARIAVNAIARSMRAAVRATSTDPLLRTAGPREIEYLEDVAGQDSPDLVRIHVDGGELASQRWTADAGSGPAWTFTGAPRERALLAHIPDDLDVFTYRDLDACSVGGPCPDLDAEATSNGLSAGDRDDVDLVELDVAARAPRVDPFGLRTEIVLRNQGFVPDDLEVGP